VATSLPSQHAPSTLTLQKKKSTLTLEAKKQAHPVASAAGHARLSGDAADFFAPLIFTAGP
jgi:hypothetical protein